MYIPNTRVLPDAEIAWRDVCLGAFVTAILFSLGKMLIGLYLDSSAVASSFGTEGSLALLLIWIYYSAQILFFGAEFTQVYANNYGSKIVPEGEEEAAQPGSKPTREVKPRSGLQPAIPVTAITMADEKGLERENQQTAHVFVGLVAASFFTGIVTTILGFRRK